MSTWYDKKTLVAWGDGHISEHLMPVGLTTSSITRRQLHDIVLNFAEDHRFNFKCLAVADPTWIESKEFVSGLIHRNGWRNVCAFCPNKALPYCVKDLYLCDDPVLPVESLRYAGQELRSDFSLMEHMIRKDYNSILFVAKKLRANPT